MNAADATIWLGDYYARFEAETRKLHIKEPFWRICQKCPDGYCCSRATYSVQKGVGNPFLVEDWHRMLTFVKERYSAKDRDRLARAILSDPEECVFMVNRRCSIYPARPWSCRTHPYTVSFYPTPTLFPVGEIELPSCPSLAPYFGLKKDELWVQTAPVTSRDTNSNLVSLKLKKHKPLWVIDASTYIREYETNMPPADRPESDWVGLFAFAKEAGVEMGELLARYVENITARKPSGGKQKRPAF